MEVTRRTKKKVEDAPFPRLDISPTNSAPTLAHTSFVEASITLTKLLLNGALSLTRWRYQSQV
jgi:hypothetical protein